MSDAVFSPSDEMMRANAQLQLGRYEASLESFRTILAGLEHQGATEFQGQAYFGAALSMLGLGRRGEARRFFEESFKQEVPYVEGGIRWGDMLLAERRFTNAKRVYRSVLQMYPHNAEVNYSLGVCLLQSGMLTDATTAFDTALSHFPSFPTALTARALMSLFGQSQARKPIRISPKRPIICVLLSPFFVHWLGGQTYLVNFVRAIETLPRHRRPRLIIAVLVDDWQASDAVRDTVQRLVACNAVKGVFDQRSDTIAPSRLLERWRRRQADAGTTERPFQRIFASVSHSFPVLHPSWGLETLGRPIFWIPDFQHHLLPANFSSGEVRSRSTDFLGIAMRDVPVVLSSKDAASHFRTFYSVRRARDYVWSFCSSLDDANAGRESHDFDAHGLPVRYYYVANQFWRHKEHATLFRAVRLLLDRGIALTVACTGADLRKSEDPYCLSLLALIEDLGIEANIKLLGVLPRATQFEVMRRSCCVIQPSSFEGWSTVVEDARSIGRPLIASDIAVHLEQLGPGGTFFRTGDADSLATVIASVDGSLPPGPSPEQEALARTALDNRLRESAEQFLRIVEAERSTSKSALATVRNAVKSIWWKLGRTSAVR